MDRKNAQILNIRLDSTSKEKVLAFVRVRVAQGDLPAGRQGRFYIVTPNPEAVLEASKDKVLARILNSADFSLPDGVGLVFAARFLGEPKLNRIPGREMFLELCRFANKKGWKIFLLGGESDEAEKTREILARSLKNIKIEALSGPILDKSGNPINVAEFQKEAESVKKINNFAPQLLFVAFGVPKQEKWIAKWLPKLNVGGAMAVGGTFSYISGKSSLPPEWMEKAGLEWLWRLVTEPWRAKRILTATILFPIKIFLFKLKQ